MYIAKIFNNNNITGVPVHQKLMKTISGSMMTTKNFKYSYESMNEQDEFTTSDGALL